MYLSMVYTVESRYNAVHYTMILLQSLQELTQTVNQRLNPQKNHHTSPWPVSYVESFVNILEKIDRVITAPHCMTEIIMRHMGILHLLMVT